MNYRHGFHAGNFADVFKHVLLTRLLLYLARKDAPFRVIDTHAGEGAYDLSQSESERTGEWRNGVGRLNDLAGADAAARALLAPYLALLGPLDANGRPAVYPGSPLIAQRLMRAQDRAIFCELRPDAFARLEAQFARDPRVKTLHIDGYTGLRAFTPPKEKRGLVLIDPPFERRDEYDAMLDAFLKAHRKWPSGVYALWHPIKYPAETQGFYDALRASGVARVLSLEFGVGGAGEKLNRTGLVIVNPPFTLDADARALIPFLSARLALGPGAGFSIDEIAGE
jgi:23S rRNA (adenine2030-N6)-methyltransferase